MSGRESSSFPGHLAGRAGWYPRDSCIHELFEARAASAPDAVAVIDEDVSLSYRALDERANQLAHHLRDRGVGPGARVAVLMECSSRLIIALLGVLKAGAAYVPLDSAHPPARLGFMIRDTGTREQCRLPIRRNPGSTPDRQNTGWCRTVYLRCPSRLDIPQQSRL